MSEDLVDDLKHKTAPSALTDKRAGLTPVPRNLSIFLNPVQLDALDILTGANWKLSFVRRPLDGPPVAVLSNKQSGEYAILCEDGTLAKEVRISIRD